MKLLKSQLLQFIFAVSLSLIIIVWLFGGVLTPFIIGAIAAYLLDPLADRLERIGFSRVFGVLLITLVALILILALSLWLLPLLVVQTNVLLLNLPLIFETIPEVVKNTIMLSTDNNSEIGVFSPDLKKLLEDDSVRQHGLSFASSILSVTSNILNFLFLIVVSPVITFYLLVDWNRLSAALYSLIPKNNLQAMDVLLKDIDVVLSGFLRGQFIVCILLGTFYALSLVLIGLEFGLIIGVVAGLLSFIPFIGTIIGGSLSLTFAVYQFWEEPLYIGIVLIIFVVGQILEGNFLTPKLVGNAVKLHPVGLMLALSVFGSLAGLTGLLLAVPVAAILGVLCRAAISSYLSSSFYKGVNQKSDN